MFLEPLDPLFFVVVVVAIAMFYIGRLNVCVCVKRFIRNRRKRTTE